MELKKTKTLSPADLTSDTTMEEIARAILLDPKAWAGQYPIVDPIVSAVSCKLDDAARILTRSQQEIKSLRQDRMIMSNRLDVFDKMYALFNGEPSRKGSNGMCTDGGDLIYEIDRFLTGSAFDNSWSEKQNYAQQKAMM